MYVAANMTVVCALEISRKHGQIFTQKDLDERFLCTCSAAEYEQYTKLAKVELKLS